MQRRLGDGDDAGDGSAQKGKLHLHVGYQRQAAGRVGTLIGVVNPDHDRHGARTGIQRALDPDNAGAPDLPRVRQRAERHCNPRGGHVAHHVGKGDALRCISQQLSKAVDGQMRHDLGRHDPVGTDHHLTGDDGLKQLCIDLGHAQVERRRQGRAVERAARPVDGGLASRDLCRDPRLAGGDQGERVLQFRHRAAGQKGRALGLVGARLRNGALRDECARAFQIGLGQGQPVLFQRKDAPCVVRLCRKLHALGLQHREVGLRLRQRQLVVGGVGPQHFRPRRDQATGLKVRMAPDHLALHLGHGDPVLRRAQAVPSGRGGTNILRRDRHHPNGQRGHVAPDLRGAGGRRDHPDRRGNAERDGWQRQERGEAHGFSPAPGASAPACRRAG